MPFPFVLPTTSHLNFQTHLTSSTHPSFPATTTVTRNALRSALKGHKRLPSPQQSNNLPNLLIIINEYIPYLLTLDAGLSGKPVSGEEVDITLVKEIEVEWRPTLLSAPLLPGRDSPRIKGRGLDYEIHNVLHTLAVVHSHLARSSLAKLHVPSSSASTTPESRISLIQTATKHFISAHGIHTHLLHLGREGGGGAAAAFPRESVDVHGTTQSCLTELSLAEATLLFVLKDDPYPALLRQSRDKNDREWMVKAPEVPRVRAHLFARLCAGAGEHAGRAAVVARSGMGESGAGGKGLTRELGEYCEDLRRVSRARACRFLGVDAEAGGKTGDGIAWLRGGMMELGLEIPKDGGEKISFAKLKSSWAGRREDRKIEKGKMEEWGADAGKLEEGRVLEWLERKWTKQNDTVSVQIVPDHVALIASLMPTGREAFGSNPGAWSAKMLAEDELARLRAPIEIDAGLGDEQSSGDEVDGDERENRGRAPAGTFPGASDGYY